MYVSTIGLWGPRRLISDGFDNIIRTFTLERRLEWAIILVSSKYQPSADR